jgi:stage III sporulation protein AB
MWLKLLGSCLVVATGTGIGYSLARRCNERPRQIMQLAACVRSLQSYISYAAMPLAEALQRSTGGVEGPVRDLLLGVARILQSCGWLTPQAAFSRALEQHGRALAFGSPEREIIVLLAANLGSTSREEQQKLLALVGAELDKIEQDALKIRDQNARMYRYLGICGGLLVVILLV